MKQSRGASGMDPSRRRWLQALTAAPVLAGAAAEPALARAALKTSARIVIAGSGLGGIAVVNRLSRMLDGAKITIIDRKEEHNYQPGYTLVATGVHLDFAQIEGMDVDAIGTDKAAGLTSVYKCAGAPLKMSFMVRDRLLKAGTLGASKISFQSALGNVFGVPVVNVNVLERWKSLGIDVEFSRKLAAIDIGARCSTAATRTCSASATSTARHAARPRPR